MLQAQCGQKWFQSPDVQANNQAKQMLKPLNETTVKGVLNFLFNVNFSFKKVTPGVFLSIIVVCHIHSFFFTLQSLFH